MHPLLKQKKTTDTFGRVERGPLPVLGATAMWPIVVKNVPIKVSKNLIADANQAFAEEQRLLAAVHMDAYPHAEQNFQKLLEEFIEAVESGALAPESEFPHSLESVRHDLRARGEALAQILRRKITKNRKIARALIEAILPQVREAREKNEAHDVRQANDWGNSVEFSEPTKILASIEQALENTLEEWDDIFPTNPNRGTVLSLLPPGMID